MQAGFVLVIVVLLALVALLVCASLSILPAPDWGPVSPLAWYPVSGPVVILVVKLCRGSSFRFLRGRIA